TNRGVLSKQSATPTALAGQTMSRAYRVLGNPRYLLAADAALEWQKQRPAVDSPWYRGLYISQLIEHYRTIHDATFLNQALDEALYLIGRQLPNGSWSGKHPLTTGEHAVLTTALLDLENNLITAHPATRRLGLAINAALNFLLENQLESGGFTSAAVELADEKTPTYEIIALIRARHVRGMKEFDYPIRGAVRALNNHESNTGNLWRATQDGRFLAMANAMVWFVQLQMEPDHESRQTTPARPDSLSGDNPVPGI
ncbi:MAG: hypothetical protein KAU50_09900, partial [Candidatus Marinimicrobia bacterium]|nr:hypothetical protein [Candidatus Neomarinimicrobiota bacterium]